MLHVDLNHIQIKGDKIRLKEELCILMKELLDTLSVEDINDCIEMAQMSEDELREKALSSIKEIFTQLPDFLQPIFEDRLRKRMKDFYTQLNCKDCIKSHCIINDKIKNFCDGKISMIDFISDPPAMDKEQCSSLFSNMFSDLL